MTEKFDARPLAARMRPEKLADFAGQSHLLAPNKALYQALAHNKVHSMILWGPPGVGKTTLAHLMAKNSDAHWQQLSAVLAGVKDIRAAVETAKQHLLEGRRTILFVDEIHRFNKSQQDAFLPHVEAGTIILIGATTENPSFHLNHALVSRLRLYTLKPLNEEDLNHLMQRSLSYSADLRDCFEHLNATHKDKIIKTADGDGRRLLNMLEQLSDLKDIPDMSWDEKISEAAGGLLRYADGDGDIFYEQISALHKSVRGSHPDAAIYWLSRLLDGGVDPQRLFRRLLAMASEDIGNADPRALTLCCDAVQAFERMGMPEGALPLAQAVTYLAAAPKSNAAYKALKAARATVQQQGHLPVPLHLCNAVTAIQKKQGYGQAYQYDHDAPSAVAYSQHYFPDDMSQETIFYQPTSYGLEAKIAERLKFIREQRQKHKKKETV